MADTCTIAQLYSLVYQRCLWRMAKQFIDGILRLGGIEEHKICLIGRLRRIAPVVATCPTGEGKGRKGNCGYSSVKDTTRCTHKPVDESMTLTPLQFEHLAVPTAEGPRTATNVVTGSQEYRGLFGPCS
mgnify:CR=1 FL=1